MIGTILLLLLMAAGAWLTYMSIIIKHEEKEALLKKYQSTENWLKDKNTRIEVVTSAKRAWIESEIQRKHKSKKSKENP